MSLVVYYFYDNIQKRMPTQLERKVADENKIKNKEYFRDRCYNTLAETKEGNSDPNRLYYSICFKPYEPCQLITKAECIKRNIYPEILGSFIVDVTGKVTLINPKTGKPDDEYDPCIARTLSTKITAKNIKCLFT